MACSSGPPQARTADLVSLAHRKAQAALSATLEPFSTLADHSARFALETIHSELADPLLDGPFYLTSVPTEPMLPSISLVFVQSRDGNTEAKDPAALGGGATDKHVIYEGLSRVSADAVLSGSKTIGKGQLLFSVWHPELVRLRRQFGKPRHPVQIVMTSKGELPIEEGLLFNVPDVPVVIIVSTEAAAESLDRRLRSRPWITIVPTGDPPDLRAAFERLRTKLGIRRISAVGGRTAATALIDAGVVRDLYLTTSPIAAGTPDTPLYTGAHPPARRLVVRKQSASGIVFEHFVLDAITS